MRTFRFRVFGLDPRREYEFTFTVTAATEERAWHEADRYVAGLSLAIHALDLVEVL